MSDNFSHGLRVIIERMESCPADFEERSGFVSSKWVRAVNLVLEGIEKGIFSDEEIAEFHTARTKLNRSIFNAMVLDILDDDTVGKNVPARERGLGKLQMGSAKDTTLYEKMEAIRQARESAMAQQAAIAQQQLYDPYMQTYTNGISNKDFWK